MSVDSKLFVSCSKDDIINIGNSVTDVLNKYSREKLDDYWRTTTDCDNRLQFLVRDDLKDESNKFSNGVSINSHNFSMFSFNFGNGDENKRSLDMFITCANDYSDIVNGYKVIFSMGCWGKYNEIMLLIGETLKRYGAVYYDFNDCDDLDFVKL